MANGTALDQNGQTESWKKKRADENQDCIKFKRRITATRGHKCKRAEHKDGRAIQKPMAQGQLGGV
jgi:hypothetical protein